MTDEHLKQSDEGNSGPPAVKKAAGVRTYAMIGAGVSLLAAGVIIGRGSGPDLGQVLSQQANGAALDRPSSQGSVRPASAGQDAPCVRVASGSLSDTVAADFASALQAAAPSWRVSTSSDPDACTPTLSLQVVAGRVSLSRYEAFDRYESRGLVGAVAAIAPGRGDTLSLVTATSDKLDTLIDMLAQNAADGLGARAMWKFARAASQPQPDGKTCIKLVGEDEYQDDDEGRRLIQAARQWYIIGGPTRTECSPDAYIGHAQTSIAGAAGQVGSMVTFALATDASIAPALTIAWAADGGRAGAQAINELMEDLPTELDGGGNGAR